MLLDVFSSFLAKSTGGCKEVCPAWGAIMRKDGSLDYELALKIMKSNLTNVIDAHPMLFNTLSCMNVCASMLEISPRLQQHTITVADVAISQAELGMASQYSMMILGINLIFAHGRDVAGPKKAQAFIDNHKTPKNAAQNDSGGSSN